jgi:hypothetical protein
MQATLTATVLPAAVPTREDPILLVQAGSRVRYEALFVDDAGDAADPTAVVLTLTDAAGAVATHAMANPGVGQYTLDQDIPDAAASAGVWIARVVGTGAIIAAAGRRIEVAQF